MEPFQGRVASGLQPRGDGEEAQQLAPGLDLQNQHGLRTGPGAGGQLDEGPDLPDQRQQCRSWVCSARWETWWCRWPAHWARLRIRGASPRGCSETRIALTGGSSSSAAQPSRSRSTAALGVDDVPLLVEQQGGGGQVSVEQAAQPGHDGGHRRVLRRPGAVARRVTTGEQKLVAGPDRDLEVLRQPHDHLRGRPRPSGLDVAEVPRADLGLVRQLELAEPTALAPLPQ